MSSKSVQPNTTMQEDLVVAGQRRVNLIWEYTQSFIAVVVVVATMVKGFSLSSQESIPTIMAVAFGTVVGFYFARTNHERTGGIGAKVRPNYVGR